MRLRTAGLLVAALTVAYVTPQAVERVALAAAGSSSSDASIVHLLNRIGYGARPGDVEKVRKMGVEKYIDLQLHPERIDDSAMDGWLSTLTTVNMTSRQIVEKYEIPQLEERRQRQLQAGQDGQAGAASTPGTPGARRNQAPGTSAPSTSAPSTPAPSTQAPRRPQDFAQMTAEERREAAQAGRGMPPGAAPLQELQEQKLLRAVYSERQLEEVLSDFWFNHFNVDARKGRVRFLLTEYEREAIRPYVLGHFRDLLGATAKSPAMLFYLDNFQSVDPEAAMSRGGQNGQGAGGLRPGRGRGFTMQMPLPKRPQQQAKNAPRGINENYARELMELHTLGVDGGYTQKDVTEVARAFTGWTIDNPRQGGGFQFNGREHDNREKTILGHTIKGGGIEDGEKVLDLLASHPSTARFISTKLARRFVSDTPPAALVDRMTKRFTETNGDIREVIRTMLTSKEFESADAFRAKVKTPLEFIVSAVRATGAELVTARPLINGMQQLGMPLYQCQPPTGYKDTAEAWTNTGALVTRMNFATNLATNRQLGMGPNQLRALGTGDALLDAVLHGDVADTTRSTVAKAQTAPQMLALALGSPEFQRR